MRLLPISPSLSSPPSSIPSSSLLVLLSFLTILPTTIAASPNLRTLTLYYTTPIPAPPSAYSLGPTQQLATLQYSLTSPADSNAARNSPNPIQVSDTTLLSFTPPANTTSPDAYTNILLQHDPSDASRRSYTSTSISTCSFHAPNTGRFLLHLDTDGEAVGARYVAYAPPAPTQLTTQKNKGGGQDKEEDGRGGFDVQWQVEAPRVYLEKPGKGGAGGASRQSGEGKGLGEDGKEEEGEKTLFQK
ncbi:MAG: hypothetical protein OHK93_004291 [Ramalina farinacea]|uniref:Uncharacterized protein n=1 Tax=Ramalina farinacea TaxID=258253 RepID=A0AA43QJL7_9LECA|nr:hypothetical protein [Ramalina farinacea]